jgi:hypothetical protein
MPEEHMSVVPDALYGIGSGHCPRPEVLSSSTRTICSQIFNVSVVSAGYTAGT